MEDQVGPSELFEKLFKKLFPFEIDMGSEYEHDDSVAELRGQEVEEAQVRELNFSELKPHDVCVAHDCRATTLVYYWKLVQEKCDFCLVHGASVQKNRTDPHWAFSFRIGSQEFLVDPLFRIAIPMAGMRERNRVYFASGTIKSFKYQYCFTKCSPEQHPEVLSSLRMFCVEKKMRFFPAMFGMKGLWMFPEPGRIAEILNTQLDEVSRLLRFPIQSQIVMTFSMNETKIGEDLQEELSKFCAQSKKEIEKQQVARAKSCTQDLNFDFQEMFRGSQLTYLALFMCK